MTGTKLVELDIDFNCPRCSASESPTLPDKAVVLVPGFRVYRIRVPLVEATTISCPICSRPLFTLGPAVPR